MGQVPTLLSLPLPLLGDRREEPPRFVSCLFLFSRDPRFQGPTEPRTPLGPPARSAPGGALPPSHVYATLPGRGAGAASCPTVGRHYLPHRAFACPGEDRSTHLHAHGPWPPLL